MLSITTTAQNLPYRISCDFSTKQKLPTGQYALQIGTAFYDLNIKKLCYKQSFPEKEVFLTTESKQYKFANDQLTAQSKLPGFIEQSIFHLCLTGDLKNFGLKNSQLTLESVEQDKGMTINTWISSIQKKDAGFKGKIIISIKDRKLFGVIFMDESGEIKSKQFYQNYTTVAGVLVPQKIVSITYLNGIEYYKMMEFSNIKINDSENSKYYDYPIPD